MTASPLLLGGFMNQVKLNEILKSKSVTIPMYVLRMFKEFNLSSDEIILLLFLYDKDNDVFNPNSIAKNTGLELGKVMEGISKICKKGLLGVVSKTNERGVKDEVLDLSPFYDKITLKVVDFLNSESDENINIYSIIEKEFDRKLSPIECETIDDWKKNNYSTELIKEAVKEAVLNGARSLRYIDKILYEWNKNGYKKKEDIKKKNKENVNKKVEIYTGDWLDLDEEL